MHARTYVCLHAHIDVCALVRVCADVGTPVHCIACIAYAYCACIRAKINTWPHHILCACTGTNGRKPQGFTRLTGAAPCPRAGGPEPGRNTSGPPPGRADLGLSTCVSVSAHPPVPPARSVALASPGRNWRGPPPGRAERGVSICVKVSLQPPPARLNEASSPGTNSRGPPPGRAHRGLSILLSVSIHPPSPPSRHVSLSCKDPGTKTKGPPPGRGPGESSTFTVWSQPPPARPLAPGLNRRGPPPGRGPGECSPPSDLKLLSAPCLLGSPCPRLPLSPATLSPTGPRS